jgi:hypothetical protein
VHPGPATALALWGFGLVEVFPDGEGLGLLSSRPVPLGDLALDWRDLPSRCCRRECRTRHEGREILVLAPPLLLLSPARARQGLGAVAIIARRGLRTVLRRKLLSLGLMPGRGDFLACLLFF